MASRIVVIGGAGEMNREALKRVNVAEPDVELVLTDINQDAVAAFAGELGGNVQHKKLDLYDEAEVRSTIRGASLVLNGAGPYVRTAKPVMDAFWRNVCPTWTSMMIRKARSRPWRWTKRPGTRA